MLAGLRNATEILETRNSNFLTFDNGGNPSCGNTVVIRMPTKMARSGSQTPLGRSGMSGAIHPLSSGLPASSENAYHPRQFRVHLGNAGLAWTVAQIAEGGLLDGRQKLVPMDYEFVDGLIRQHEEGFDHGHRLWVLYVFHLWARTVGAVTAIDRGATP